MAHGHNRTQWNKNKSAKVRKYPYNSVTSNLLCDFCIIVRYRSGKARIDDQCSSIDSMFCDYDVQKNESILNRVLEYQNS